jgi:tetratricopeptide (TPR) repeat protein
MKRIFGAGALACGILLAACSPGAAPGAAHAAAGGAPYLQGGQSVQELLDRGQAFATVGDLTRGEQYLSAALRRGAEVRRVLPLLVHVCVEAGRYRVAADYVRAYLPDDPENATLHMLSGLLEAAVGDRDVARREYETVLRSHPDDSSAHFALAILLRDASADARAADAHFREYLRLAPGGEHAAEARASLLEEMR